MNSSGPFSLLALAFVLAAAPGWSAPAPPDSVRIEDRGEAGFLVVSWPAVPGADGYQIYREVGMSVEVDSEGGVVPLEDPAYLLVPWGYVAQPDGAVVRVKIALLSQEERFFFGVATVQDGIESELVWPIQPDFNQDGRVDLDDYFLFADAFGSRQRRFDLDRDGRVNLADFFLFTAAFGSTRR